MSCINQEHLTGNAISMNQQVCLLPNHIEVVCPRAVWFIPVLTPARSCQSASGRVLKTLTHTTHDNTPHGSLPQSEYFVCHL